MSANTNHLLRHWRKHRIEINEGLSSEKLQKLEAKLGYYFPEEFKLYLLNINGMVEGEADDSLFYFWDSQIIESSKELSVIIDQETAFVAFADRIVIESLYLIEVKKLPFLTGRVAIKKRDLQIIEPSFRSFIEGYIYNIEDVIPNWETCIQDNPNLDYLSKHQSSSNLLLMQT